ncbi:MAG: nitrilase-related carbon-nitrogen hydrolase [Acidobacteriota bacterium]
MAPAADTYRIHLAQIAPALGDLAANLDLHLARIEAARVDGARLVVFPELSLTGYGLQDLVPEVAMDPATGPLLEPIRQASRRLDVVLGLVEEADEGSLYNTAAWFSEGRLLARHRKVHLPTYGLFDEGRYFAPGQSVRAFDTPFGRAGLLVCEDLWHPALTYVLAQDGTDLLVVISSSPGRGVDDPAMASQRPWHLLGEAAARFHTQFVVFVGRVGTEDGQIFGGGSFIYGPDGAQLAACPLLEEHGISVDVDRQALRTARQVNPLRRDDRPALIHRELGRLLASNAGDVASKTASSPRWTE